LTGPRQRALLHCGRDLLLRRRNTLLLSRPLRAQRRFGSAGCSGRIVADLKYVSFGLGMGVGEEYLLIQDQEMKSRRGGDRGIVFDGF
jgi:hypothetical protein